MASAPKAIKLLRAEKILELCWEGESPARLPARRLRCECRCAGCIDEITGARLLDAASVPLDVQIDGAQLAGNYAIKLTFSDGHDAGLFTWNHLHELKKTDSSAPG